MYQKVHVKPTIDMCENQMNNCANTFPVLTLVRHGKTNMDLFYQEHLWFVRTIEKEL